MAGDPSPPRRLLIVDDQPDLLFILTRQLAREGIAATVCTSPADALQALAGGSFIGALVDLYFGDLPAGWDLVSAIRQDERHARLPIVSMSGA
ncbi:MAG: response regulator, partial [Elusimicrobia bacterium]|nr:response regulator [Elusimicrobiota bacterium]